MTGIEKQSMSEREICSKYITSAAGDGREAY